MLAPLQIALAKPTPQKGLIKQTPKFDTSLSPKRSHFQLTIKRIVLLPPADPSALLHGDNRVIRLRAGESDRALRGEAAEDHRAMLRGEATEDKGNVLRGKAAEDHRAMLGGEATKDKRNLLRGKATEANRNSIISTLEHGVKPRFYVDLRKISPKFAPEISRLMEAEVAEARRKVAYDVNVMENELRSLPPRPDLPPTPARAGLGANALKALESELAQSKQQEQRRSQTAIQQYEVALSHAQGATGKMPASLQPQVVMPAAKPVGIAGLSVPSSSRSDTSAAEREMAAELERANLHLPSKTQLNAELAMATKQARVAVVRAQPAMDTILTHLRKIPPAGIPVASSAEPKGEDDAYSTLKWDVWHARFAELARNPILKSVSKAGNPAGANTVEIGVSTDHRVTVRFVQTSNPAFDQAILQAYRSLDGNPALAYPAGSRRSSITFLIDNTHTGAGVPTGVKSQTSVGDKEIVRQQR